MVEPQIILASLPNYDEVVAEIHFRGKFFAQLSCVNGKILLETAGPEFDHSAILHSIELSDFLRAVEVARQRLLGEGDDPGSSG